MTSGLVLMAGAGAATAIPTAPNDHQIAICHATGSDSNPYTIAYPSKKQISEDNGHMTGQGVHPDDIIPPFEEGEHGNSSWDAFAGMNWDADGQMVFNNDCKVEKTTPTATATATVSATVTATATATATGSGTAAPGDDICPPGGSAPGDVDGLPNEEDEDEETPRENKCVEAINPVVNQSEECEVEGTLRIRQTRGVEYLFNGQPIEAGIHRGPLSGTVTARPSGPAFELSNPNFSFEVNLAPAEDCPTATPSVTPTVTDTPTVLPTETVIPPEETETVTVTPTIKGTEAVPTAVDAGMPGGPTTPSSSSSTDLLAQLLVGGGLALLMAAGWLQMGRQNRGVHQI